MQCGYRNLYCTFPKLVVWRIDIDYKYKPHSTLNNKNIRFNSLLRSLDIDKVVKKKIYNPKKKNTCFIVCFGFCGLVHFSKREC